MSPLSRDPRRRQRQLDNLQRGGGRPASVEHRPALRHGAYAVIAAERLEAKVREVFDALAADAPMRGSDGSLPVADGAVVRLAAEVLCRLDNVTEYLGRRGIEDERGELRLAVLDVEGRLRREAADHLDALGCTPRSRAKLGLDVARAQTFDLAQHWAQEPDVIEAGSDG